jgi:sodium-dependent dicarboxylate transporter 2/3/5
MRSFIRCCRYHREAMSDSSAGSIALAPSRTVARVGLIAGPAVALLIYLLLPAEYRQARETGSGDGDAGIHMSMIAFTHAGRATLALMVWMAVWWLSEAIDISATALLPLVVLPASGAASIDAAAAPYADKLIFLFMGGFIMALSMQRWHLDQRIALLTLRLVGTRQHFMIGGFMIATAALSGFVSNSATAAMMLPVGLSVTHLVRTRIHIGEPLPAGLSAKSGRSQDGNFATALMLGIAYSASIGGLATIVGTPPNVFLASYMKKNLHQEISFRDWMLIGVPLVAVFLPLCWLLLTRVLFPVPTSTIPGGKAHIREQYRALGPVSSGQIATFIVFVCAAGLWIMRTNLAKVSIAGVSPFQNLDDPGIAIAAALALFVIPVRGGAGGFVMDWPTASRLPWGILILFGGGLSLAQAIQQNGVAEFIASHTHHLGAQPVVLVIAVTTLVIFFSELASNTATVITLVPILAAMAPGLGVSPLLLIIPATLAASCAFMMPVGTPPNAMVFGSGEVSMKQMAKAGFWLNLIGLVLIVLLTLVVATRVLPIAPAQSAIQPRIENDHS